MKIQKQALPHYPNASGVYILSDVNGKKLYIGRSKQLCRRVSHLTAMQIDKSNKVGFSHIKAKRVRDHQEEHGQVFVEFMPCNNPVELEKELIKKYSPHWNNT